MKRSAEKRLAEAYLDATRPGRLPREWALVSDVGILAAATTPAGLEALRAEIGGTVHYRSGGVVGAFGWAPECENGRTEA